MCETNALCPLKATFCFYITVIFPCATNKVLRDRSRLKFTESVEGRSSTDQIDMTMDMSDPLTGFGGGQPVTGALPSLRVMKLWIGS